MQTHRLATITAMVLSDRAHRHSAERVWLPPEQPLPRTADGKPDLQGIWQASSSAAADLQRSRRSFVEHAGGQVGCGRRRKSPISLGPRTQRAENFQNRQTADPLSKCYIPGVPRIMYLDFPFQIFQTPKAITMAFEWELDYRLIYTDGTPHPEDEILDGRFPRPLGGRHPGGGRRQHQRQNLVRHGGGLSQ